MTEQRRGFSLPPRTDVENPKQLIILSHTLEEMFYIYSFGYHSKAIFLRMVYINVFIQLRSTFFAPRIAASSISYLCKPV
ncbi:hypothetical protein NPIL_127981 [Nephila pilipes]|uniref:Uncharacterized protein n=1 Tax=Nephila pilipes TaxID=299642 RepID=A0A8X6UQE9_NEPPI|nr:hypothetical protein NPIL_127981 [Nephila pilipes]